jgi:hypothetical protein
MHDQAYGFDDPGSDNYPLHGYVVLLAWPLARLRLLLTRGRGGHGDAETRRIAVRQWWRGSSL